MDAVAGGGRATRHVRGNRMGVFQALGGGGAAAEAARRISALQPAGALPLLAGGCQRGLPPRGPSLHHPPAPVMGHRVCPWSSRGRACGRALPCACGERALARVHAAFTGSANLRRAQRGRTCRPNQNLPSWRALGDPSTLHAKRSRAAVCTRCFHVFRSLPRGLIDGAGQRQNTLFSRRLGCDDL